MMASVPRRGFIARLEAPRGCELMGAEGTSGASIQGDMIRPRHIHPRIVSPAGPSLILHSLSLLFSFFLVDLSLLFCNQKMNLEFLIYRQAHELFSSNFDNQPRL